MWWAAAEISVSCLSLSWVAESLPAHCGWGGSQGRGGVYTQSLGSTCRNLSFPDCLSLRCCPRLWLFKPASLRVSIKMFALCSVRNDTCSQARSHNRMRNDPWLLNVNCSPISGYFWWLFRAFMCLFFIFCSELTSLPFLGRVGLIKANRNYIFGSYYHILPCIMCTHVFGPKRSGK